jgi:antagonist of KipI
MKCRVDGHPIPNDLSWFVRQGSLIEFSSVAGEGNGLRTYFAVAGGIDVPVVLGSRSTSLQAHFGGYSGSVITAGDILNGGTIPVDVALVSGRFWPGSTPGVPRNTAAIRYIPYIGRGAATSKARAIFRRVTFECTADSDRMGVRLRPLDIERLPTGGSELLSFGIVRGAIQLPPGGHPIVLGADHQTTGGYPLLGVVPQVDWPILAQLRPGSQVRFEPIDASENGTLRVQANRELELGLVRLGGLYPDLTA